MYLIEDYNEDAYNIFFKKYSVLIAKKLKEYNVKNDFSDYFQESLIVLNRSIEKFDSKYGTFYNYFLINLVNRLNSLKKMYTKKYTLVDELDFFFEKNEEFPLNNYEYLECLNEEEKKIVYLKFVKNLSAQEIENEYFISKSKVYYLVRIIRKKIKKWAERY